MTDSRPEQTSAPPSESGSALDSPPQDACYDVLADRRRRYAVESLGECQTPMAVADLADEVAAREHAAPLADVSDEERERVLISLHHLHLPKLADWEVVEYARERGNVSLTPEGERVRAFLDDVTDVLL
ncbi:permease [Halogeometricum sp. S1BR25-6]|uniref:Permease n=1 Tax=Halogeometricum salsisoli TaxID=2950536 RepID=A0ABU2GAT2_9EURY|nr:permease [Halogeometricum sp. S1BR25-6]MDS0297591.1 permease [Halogeometricum sp. S1BR25-6]